MGEKTITIAYKCNTCDREASLEVPVSKDYPDAKDWFEADCRQAVAEDHREYSPNCPGRSVLVSIPVTMPWGETIAHDAGIASKLGEGGVKE